MNDFILKDSGERQTFASGMVRDIAKAKIVWHSITEGPMLKRWARLLTRGKIKYPDVAPGVGNWTLANGNEEYQRFRESCFRHFMQWYYGNVEYDDDGNEIASQEDHAAAVFFNMNGAEYVKERMAEAAKQ